jgi:hypothetical protein
MAHDDGAEHNLDAIMDFHHFRVFIFKIDLITNKHGTVNPHSSQLVEKGSEAGGAGCELGYEVKDAICDSTRKRFMHLPQESFWLGATTVTYFVVMPVVSGLAKV